ncbi:hypothetical protein GLUCOINTEAF2_0203819 [Komagataeibacter intermedius AF2]|uniref:Uncharacterized protein n=1 Tax=Komagataeibacter intermedius AF2 TaxID=1458464 RepID=A0A0N1FB53_9PROT|nr:hypothetical protein GLUCOINTEAF2_0203819 [Komagataeibacter intermedius AF2]
MARPERSEGWQGDGYFASRCKARHARRKIAVSAIAGPVWLTPAPLPERPRARLIRKRDSPARHTGKKIPPSRPASVRDRMQEPRHVLRGKLGMQDRPHRPTPEIAQIIVEVRQTR